MAKRAPKQEGKVPVADDDAARRSTIRPPRPTWAPTACYERLPELNQRAVRHSDHVARSLAEEFERSLEGADLEEPLEAQPAPSGAAPCADDDDEDDDVGELGLFPPGSSVRLRVP
jgi:hypothetical protein